MQSMPRPARHGSDSGLVDDFVHLGRARWLRTTKSASGPLSTSDPEAQNGRTSVAPTYGLIQRVQGSGFDGVVDPLLTFANGLRQLLVVVLVDRLADLLRRLRQGSLDPIEIHVIDDDGDG